MRDKGAPEEGDAPNLEKEEDSEEDGEIEDGNSEEEVLDEAEVLKFGYATLELPVVELDRAR
jgi:hypothetical protein